VRVVSCDMSEKILSKSVRFPGGVAGCSKPAGTTSGVIESVRSNISVGRSDVRQEMKIWFDEPARVSAASTSPVIPRAIEDRITARETG
jgi:hypothetical protein